MIGYNICNIFPFMFYEFPELSEEGMAKFDAFFLGEKEWNL